MKNILAENMRRFGTKNLSEQFVSLKFTLNYDNGMLRSAQLFGQDGRLVWYTNASFNGANNILTLKEIVFTPGDSVDVKPGAKAVTIPLLKAFNVTCPIIQGIPSSRVFGNGIRLKLNALGLEEMEYTNLNVNIGRDIYTALSNYAVDKGYYTKPKQTAKPGSTVIFINHDGQKDLY